MAAKALNSSFQAAKAAKEDEFYTQLADIERELKHYQPHFKDKVVYCNCDDPRVSNFFHYFSYNLGRHTAWLRSEKTGQEITSRYEG